MAADFFRSSLIDSIVTKTMFNIGILIIFGIFGIVPTVHVPSWKACGLLYDFLGSDTCLHALDQSQATLLKSLLYRRLLHGLVARAEDSCLQSECQSPLAQVVASVSSLFLVFGQAPWEKTSIVHNKLCVVVSSVWPNLVSTDHLPCGETYGPCGLQLCWLLHSTWARHGCLRWSGMGASFKKSAHA